jgi:Zn-dependent alcohol dehydrogenase
MCKSAIASFLNPASPLGAALACAMLAMPLGAPGEKVTISTLPIHFNKVLTGSHGGDAVPHVDISRLMRLAAAGKLGFDGIITHAFPLEQINAALEVVRGGAAGVGECVRPVRSK